MSDTGIDTYILKVASVCNLNCTYCYYFNGADTSWRERRSMMSHATVKRIVDQLIPHARAHGIDAVDLVVHGGEPFIMKKDRFLAMMREFDRIEEAGISVRRKGQTNGVLLDDEWVDILARENFHLGVSIDGPKDVNDAYRVDHSGHGSYDRAIAGLKLALSREASGLDPSVISVINPDYSGSRMYEHLRSLGVKRMDFLLPESNYAHPPDGYQPLGPMTPYGDFLREVADAWFAEDDPDVFVRLVGRISEALLGGDVRSDVIGTAPVRVAVIETDGALEPTDNYKACEDRMTDLGLNIWGNTFDDLYGHEFFRYCTAAGELVPSACGGCKYVSLCGGGRMTTRYSREEGFQRRSIYCNDLYTLYKHLEHKLQHLLEPGAVGS